MAARTGLMSSQPTGSAGDRIRRPRDRTKIRSAASPHNRCNHHPPAVRVPLSRRQPDQPRHFGSDRAEEHLFVFRRTQCGRSALQLTRQKDCGGYAREPLHSTRPDVRSLPGADGLARGEGCRLPDQQAANRRLRVSTVRAHRAGGSGTLGFDRQSGAAANSAPLSTR